MTDTITAARNVQAPHQNRTCVSEKPAAGPSGALDFRFAGFEIDVARQELRRAGAVVHIEPQVFDLIVYLIQHRERIVSKDELIEAIWQGRFVSEAALSSRISSARRALGDSGNDQSLIRTLRKRGFRFVGEIVQTSSGPIAMAGGQPATRHSTVNENDAPRLVPNEEPLLLPDTPSIAVLPFQNMGQDPDQEYFADGLTEDIITGLSRQRWFSVIASTSSFTYKGQAVDVRNVAARLGVRYVLEGSVRTAANRVRVTGQLIDATKGNHLWAEKYDRELADVFALQDDIATRVIGSVGPQILLTEAARIQRKPPQSIDARHLVMRAVPHMWRLNGLEQMRALEQLQRAITLDPEYAHAHALLGWVYLTMFDLDTPVGEFTNRALAAGTRAITLDNEDPLSYLVVGLGHARRGRSNLALSHLTKSVELSPCFALGHAGLGYALAVGGQPEGGLQSVEQAHRLSRCDPFLVNYAPVVRYTALFALKRYEETVAVCRATVASHPKHAGAWRFLTASLGLMGRIDEAREALIHALTLQADLSDDKVYSDPADRARVMEGLWKAGLKG